MPPVACATVCGWLAYSQPIATAYTSDAANPTPRITGSRIRLDHKPFFCSFRLHAEVGVEGSSA
jgi:hypothetical protein